MFENLFQSTVSALCYEISGAHGAPCAAGENAMLAPPYNDIAQFVIGQRHAMPQFLGTAMQLATLLFAFAALARGGNLFHRLRPPQRRVQVAAWTVSRLAPCRDLMRLYTSLVILALYSRPPLAAAPIPGQLG